MPFMLISVLCNWLLYLPRMLELGVDGCLKGSSEFTEGFLQQTNI